MTSQCEDICHGLDLTDTKVETMLGLSLTEKTEFVVFRKYEERLVPGGEEQEGNVFTPRRSGRR